MDLIALPALADNYIWMLHDGMQAAVVDPGDAAPVIDALDRLHLQLAAILVTHHHADHVGGIPALRSRLQGTVFGPAREAITPPFEPLQDGDRIDILGLPFAVIDVPGHTAGHIAYAQVADSRQGQAGRRTVASEQSEASSPDNEAGHPGSAPLLFCGDTLFSAGCGRLFEGTAAQMHASLARLATLPGHTRVCCTHEYTLSNLRFAAAVEPGNAAVVAHARHCQALRDQGMPTLPSTLALELQINPFLRCGEADVIAAAHAQGAASDDGVAVLAALREWKNRFR